MSEIQCGNPKYVLNLLKKKTSSFACLQLGARKMNQLGVLWYNNINQICNIHFNRAVFVQFDNQSNMPILQRCEFCQKSGATVGCCLATCTSNYHFMCSRAKNCVFLEDKKVYCPRHKDLIKGEVRPMPLASFLVPCLFFARMTYSAMGLYADSARKWLWGLEKSLCGFWRN